MTNIIAIDPGPIVGVCLLRLPSPAGRPDAYYAEIAQCTPNCLWALIAGWLDAYQINAIAAERFVVGPLAARVNDPQASTITRDILGGLQLAVPETVRRILRSAADVKLWATNDRLKRAGLYDPTEGMRHARDATRHALYAACKDFGARDPLSRKGVPA